MHPLYLQRLREWLFLRASYLGEPEWSRQGVTATRKFPFFEDNEDVDADSVHYEPRAERSYLSRHPREEDEDYEARLELTPYYNFVKPFVAAYVGAVMRAVKSIKVPASMMEWLEDVDGHGTSYARHAEDWLTWAVVFGHSHSHIKKPAAPEKPPDSLAHERAMGLDPKVCVRTPVEMPGWSFDPARGVYDWSHLRYPTPIRTEAPKRPDHTPMPTSGTLSPEHYADMLITPKRVVTVVDDVETTGPGVKFVPVVTLIAHDDPTTGEPVGWSFIRDVAEAAREAYNQLSWLLDQEKNSCFNQLVLHTQRKLTRTKSLRLGTSSYIASEAGATFIAPEMGPLDHLSAQIPQTVERARTMLSLDHDGKEGVEAASALSMKREMLDTALATLAERAESAFRAELRMVATLMGATPDEVEVEIGRDFSGLTRIARMEQALSALRDAGMSGKPVAAIQGLVLDALFPEMEEAEREALHAELEDMADTALEAEQAAAENPMGLPTDENGEPMGEPPKAAPPGLKPGKPKVAQKPGKPFGGGAGRFGK